MSDITERLTVAIANRYKIESHLGQGGMATVYLAEDIKHDRKVALKVLRPELAAVIGAERFLQEIKVTANLQHPHILPLHDSGEADTFLYYVMPYIEGESLRDKLDREKQLGIEDALEITKSVAAALDYAHRQGVIHRDIKPENILIHDGQAQVADFGIALAVSEASGNRLTETGLSIGTPHYMSPEQAMGDRELDARSDVYSLGAMLYEMLAGDPPYQGSTAQAIVAKVITEKAPPVTAIRDTVPSHVAAAVQKSLSKLPADRFPTAAEFADALTQPTLLPMHGVDTSQLHVRPRRTPRTFSERQFVVVTAVAIIVLAAALWGWLRPAPTPDLSRFAVLESLGQEVALNHGGTTLALSPDGRRFVYTGPERQLFVREMGQLQARPLPGTEDARAPFFSPDGEWVGFFANNRLHRVALGGGPPLTVTDVQAGSRGASWGDNDMIVFSPSTGSGLFEVSSAGGEPTQITTLDSTTGESSHRWPAMLPGSNGVVFTIFGGAIDEAELAALDFESREVRRLGLLGLHPQYTTTGHLVYGAADGSLVAVPFDARRLEVTGPPVSLLEGVMTRSSVVSEFAVSPSGELAYLSGAAPELSLAFVSRDGREKLIAENLQDLRAPRVSSDGNRIVMEVSEGTVREAWIHDLVEGTLTRMSFQGATYPVWSPDDTFLTFSSVGEGSSDVGLYKLRSDGSGVQELVYEAPGPQWEGLWMPDGRSLIVRETNAGTSRDIFIVELESEGEPLVVAETEFDERSPAISPDGRWISYVSNESGREEVFVRPVPGPGGKRQVSDGGGTEPLWARDGREIFYRGVDGNMYAVAIRTTPTLSVGRRTVLFADEYVHNASHTNYDVHPVTGEFIMVKASNRARTNLVIVLNWYEELKGRMER